MTQAQLYLKAIDLNPSFSNAYNNLELLCPMEGSTQLLNGTTMTQAQLYLKAIDLNPSYSQAYHNLGTALPDGGSTPAAQWHDHDSSTALSQSHRS